MKSLALWMLLCMLAAGVGVRVFADTSDDTCGCSFVRWDVVTLIGGGKALMIDHATGKLALGDLPALPLPPAPKQAPKDSF